MIKKHKTKFITAAVVFALLAGAWFLGGMPEVNHPTPETMAEIEVADEPVFVAQSVTAEDVEIAEELDEIEEIELFDKQEIIEEIEIEEIDEAEEVLEDEEADSNINFDIVPEVANPDRFDTTPEGVVLPDINPADIQIFDAGHPAMRAPVEPEDMVIGDGSFTVTLSVRAHTILYNMHLLHRDKHELVPDDGWIFPPTEVVVYEGESVFNVLQREMRRHRIHMVARWTPIFNSAYVEAINNLYEFDVGLLSGWMYSVNGWFPNFGASRYLLSPGDVVEWAYTVDLGRDLGVMWLGGEE